MNINLTLNLSATWFCLISFLAGAALVGLLWRRDAHAKQARLDRVANAVRNILFDSRRNSLIENVVSRAEKGNSEAIQDWELLRKLFWATLSFSVPIRAVYEKYVARITNSK